MVGELEGSCKVAVSDGNLLSLGKPAVRLCEEQMTSPGAAASNRDEPSLIANA